MRYRIRITPGAAQERHRRPGPPPPRRAVRRRRNPAEAPERIGTLRAPEPYGPTGPVPAALAFTCGNRVRSPSTLNGGCWRHAGAATAPPWVALKKNRWTFAASGAGISAVG